MDNVTNLVLQHLGLSEKQFDKVLELGVQKVRAKRKAEKLFDTLSVHLTEYWLSHGKDNKPCFTDSYIREVRNEVRDMIKLLEGKDPE